MKVIYNNKMVSENNIVCSVNHRGLTYGDGLFETLIFKEGVVQYLERHLSRLQKGMTALGMIAEDIFDPGKIEKDIKELILVNKIGSLARIKIIVWRKNGGLYTPLDNRIDFMISAINQSEDPQNPIEAELSEQIKIFPSPYSRFKTCNMLPHIMAGLEKQKRNLSELVLVSYDGHLAECSSSNLFWAKDGVFFTPSFDTGCIEGIMRGVLIDKLVNQGKSIKEVKEFPEALLQADAAFTTNVSGIKPFKRFNKKQFDDSITASILKPII